jgi:hypothetical protein
MVNQAIADPAQYTTSFGYSGTYLDYVHEIIEQQGGLKRLINLDILKDDIISILKEAGFMGYRLDGATEWIVKTVQILRELVK